MNKSARNARIARIEQAGRGCGKNDGLAVGDPEILPVFLFGVRERNFVAQAVIECKARREFKSVLGVEVHGIAAKIAGRITATLQEKCRLADEEICEGIGERRRSEDKKAVAGDAKEDVEAILAVAAAEFEFVATTNPSKRSVEAEIAIPSLMGAGDGIADGS